MRELDSFFHDIGYRLKIAQDTKKLLDKRLASSFSLFPYIAPNENRISEIIRDLLDPNGNHGQGDIFLQKFLEIIEQPELYESGDHAFIRTEEHTTSIENNKRRIDILIEIKRNNQHHAGIAIENKPWAIDQNKQIDDYVEHIRQRYPNYYIVYLTPDGREPPEHSAAKTKINDKEALLPISYERHIASWLDACHKESQAEYVRQFLLDFSNYCRQPNLNHQNMKNTEIEYQTVIEYILDQENEDKFRTGLLICNQKITAGIKSKIIEKFSKNIEEKIKSKYLNYETKSNLEYFPDAWCSLSLTKLNYPIHIRLENDSKFANDFYIGIVLKDEHDINQQLRDIIFNDLVANHSRNGDNNDAWIYWAYLEKYRSWTDDTETLFKLHKHPETIINYIIEQFDCLITVIEKHSEKLATYQPAE
jgi:hypothetical protein